MQRDDYQFITRTRAYPAHAMNGGFMVQPHRVPALGPIRGRNEIENGAAVARVPRVPLGADGDLGFTIAIRIGGGDADVIARGEFLGNYVLGPIGVLVPD